MKKLCSIFVLCMLLFGCGAHEPKEPLPKGAHLTLTATPRQGFAPLRVSFHVVLENVPENDKSFYCLKEEWDFGDGAVSAEQPQCAPYGPDTKVNTEYFVEHVYENLGSYDVFFTLGDKKIRSNKIQINALENRVPSS